VSLHFIIKVDHAVPVAGHLAQYAGLRRCQHTVLEKFGRNFLIFGDAAPKALGEDMAPQIEQRLERPRR